MITKIQQTNFLLTIILVLFFIPSFVLTSFAQQTNGGCSFGENDLNNLTSNRNLYFGARGEDVKLLQKFLCSSSNTYFEEKNITGYFGNITKSKVAELQQKFNITPSLGYFGNITKNYLTNNKNEILKTSSNQNISDVNSKSTDISNLFSKIKNLQTNNIAKNYDELDQNFEIKISSSGIKTKDSYIQKFLELSKNTDILSSDLDKLPRKNGVPLSIPSLVDEYVKQGAIKNKEELIGGLDFWNKVIKKGIEQISTIEITNDLSYFQKQTLAWMKYNQKFINDILISDFNKDYLSQKFSRYVNTYKKYGVSALNNFDLSSSGQKNNYFADFFEKIKLIKITNAISSIPFGGTIAIVDTCSTGELLEITHPMGAGSGAFFLYWLVYSINTFPYGIVEDGNWILGSAYGGPGWCNKGTANYSEGEGTIIYFGTANQ